MRELGFDFGVSTRRSASQPLTGRPLPAARPRSQAYALVQRMSPAPASFVASSSEVARLRRAPGVPVRMVASGAPATPTAGRPPRRAQTVIVRGAGFRASDGCCAYRLVTDA